MSSPTPAHDDVVHSESFLRLLMRRQLGLSIACAATIGGVWYAPQYDYMDFWAATDNKPFQVIIRGSPFSNVPFDEVAFMVERGSRVRREVGIPVGVSWNLGLPAVADRVIRACTGVRPPFR